MLCLFITSFFSFYDEIQRVPDRYKLDHRYLEFPGAWQLMRWVLVHALQPSCICLLFYCVGAMFAVDWFVVIFQDIDACSAVNISNYKGIFSGYYYLRI